MAEFMGGWAKSSLATALRYQQGAMDRDFGIALALSKIAER